MNRSRCRKVVLLLDCCYSGAFTRDMLHRSAGSVDVTDRLGGSGCAVLCSSTALEYSFEVNQGTLTGGRPTLTGTPPSIFTSAIIEGLRTGEADVNGDGRVSVDELYDYTYERIVERTPNQRPTKFLDVQGELVVASNPRGSRPKELPEGVAAAADSPLADVRLGAIETLRKLAEQELKAGVVGPAHERLRVMTDDDSRAVSAKAREARDELGRAGVQPPRPPWAPPAPPWQIPAPAISRPPWPDRPAARPPALPGDGLGTAMLAYLLPFFLALPLVRARSGLARFHAWQCVAIDALMVVYTVIGTVIGVVYGMIRYGTAPIPQSDIVLTVFTAGFLALPVVLRMYCMVALAARKSGRITGLAPIAEAVSRRRN